MNGLERSNISDLTDEELIKCYLSEESEQYFEEIFYRYSSGIYTMAYGITQDHHKSEDVFQEVFTLLTTKINTFRGDSKFSTWLFRVVTNVIYGNLRKERKHDNVTSLENCSPCYLNRLSYNEGTPKEWNRNPYSVMYKKEVMNLIEKAIKELPKKNRIVFQLRDIEQLSNEQISEVLGITIDATKSRLHRARLFVRKKVSDYFL